ncbi:hypothetical protein BKA82DRAFT_1006010 [Pisolithus tinctorius]|uniref:Uncharacterized protein n=1 Tax=Pisolithus tinctorius Marx 270 TaxID=870435 RepID=A0A0C3NQL9_PISTI|nr:hypothetical protein BKA82DRAFT_1006010 [Pisolithus tinctorius]KIN97608.1 hypothetical protein M404DRAFT_1006010 [Pisolithus tinctorius Marx 270]
MKNNLIFHLPFAISRSSLLDQIQTYTSDSSLQHLQEWDINSPHLHHAPEMLPQ